MLINGYSLLCTYCKNLVQACQSSEIGILRTSKNLKPSINFLTVSMSIVRYSHTNSKKPLQFQGF
ncbi:hypothetical protein C8D72_1794 [Kushneria indalinina DSM 14324]|uniref:Uncharacterized protein n=1 Tax=Kushneria indalinina DSM 14324 TaxID=1122140 RepID=A0A3D9DW05_9GAMM|nr:hypothetical protein C8D72_1794 [Kushneria indalinina DSM 14324]